MRRITKTFKVLRLLSCAAAVLLLSQLAFAQTKPVIYVGEFKPYETSEEADISDSIQARVVQEFEANGFEVLTTRGPLSNQLSDAQGANARFLVNGYYSRGQEINNINIYGQVYNPESGYLIDAFNLSDEVAQIEGIELDPDELRVPDEERIEEFSRTVVLNIRANPERRERHENIDQYVLSTPIGDEMDLPVAQVDISEASEDVFRIFEEENQVSVASNVVTDIEKQPASISIINRRQIRISGARTLNELLTIFVPGYFTVEDQDDIIGGFRGFAPDSNSKILLLVNGHNLNTEWFWGPPDSILQGIDLGYIERIEVIRGPGSVTLGQGALLGVINIVTKKGSTNQGTSLAFGAGQDEYTRVTIESGMQGEELPDLRTHFYMSRTFYNGQRLRSEGWAHDKAYETQDGFFELERGLITFEDEGGSYEGTQQIINFPSGVDGKELVLNKNVATSGSRLKKTESILATGVIQYRDFEFTGLYTDQQRDNYSFFRDRNEVQNIVKSANARYRHELGDRFAVTTSAQYAEDDLILHSHLGRVMGGTREIRYGGSIVLNVLGLPKDNNLAVGVEYRRYDMGQTDRNGNNNIINNANEDLLEDNNTERTYVFTDSIRVGSFFLEDFYSITDAWDIFVAFRYDKHEFWGFNVSPRVGTLWNPTEDIRLRLSYQQGFRGAPGVQFAGGFRRDGLLRADNFDQVAAAEIPTTDRFDNDTVYDDVPEAEPETIDSYEFAFNYRFNDNWSLDSVFFYNIVRNIVDVGVIFADADAFEMPELGSDLPGDWNGYFFFRNLPGEIRNGGAELSLKHRSRYVTGTVSHSVVRVLSASRTLHNEFGGGMYLTGDADNLHHRAYPENVSRLNLLFHLTKSLDISTNVLYYANFYTPPGKREEGQHVVNAGLIYAPIENLEFTVEGKNITRSGKLWPMNSNAGGRENSAGAPSLEEATWWASVRYIF